MAWVNKHFVAGLFVLGGSVVLLVVAFIVGSQEGMVKRKFPLEVVFQEVGGLEVGAPVRLLGVNVGQVTNMKFLREDGEQSVKVKLAVFESERNSLTKGSVFKIVTESVLGMRLVSIEPGPSKMPLDVTKPQMGLRPLNLDELAVNTNITVREVGETFTLFKKNLGELRYVVSTLKRLIDRIEEKLIKDELVKVF